MAEFDFKDFMNNVRYEAGEARRPRPDVSDLWHLFCLKNDEFIFCAYQCLLKREVDPAGLEVYTPKSRTFWGRAYIAYALLSSPESGKIPVWMKKSLSLLKRTLYLKKSV